MHRSKALEPLFDPNSTLMRAIARVDPAAKPVRVIAFNKSKTSNWGVPWHQDRVIEVKRREGVSGYHNWPQKAGAWHCEPPQDILDRMLFVRVHLSDTDQANGAMKIAVGSHANGLVRAEVAAKTASTHPIEYCDAQRGDILVLKMLTLHASDPAPEPTERRVLRIDFAAFDLPAPLAWAF